MPQYVPTFWNDGSDAFGLRWSVRTSVAAIVSALLSILITFTLSRFLSLLATLFALTLAKSTVATVVDDQINAIAVNNTTPSDLLYTLGSFAFRVRRRAFRSSIFFVFLLVSLLAIASQAGLIFFVGQIVSEGPIPSLLGVCGTPDLANSTGNDTRRLSVESSKRAFRAQAASQQFLRCRKDNSTAASTVCDAPILEGKSFRWTVEESLSNTCWFGGRGCFNDSATITQRATITVEDLGTTRKPIIAIALVSHCSNLDLEPFRYHFQPTNTSTNYIGYELGSVDSAGGIQLGARPNTTFYVRPDQESCGAYSSDYVSYPQGSSEWIPSQFLLKNLHDINNSGNNSTDQNLLVIVNKQWGVSSLIPNNDPFYRTGVTHIPDMYPPSAQAQAIICREHFRFYARADLVSQSEEEIEIASVPMRLVGTGGNKMQELKDLLTTFKANQSDQRLANETASQVMLITFPFTYSPIADQMDDLKGSTFIATSTLQAGLQSGEPTTHAEVVRWFGTSVLLALGNALFVTSDENDWGYGVKLPAWPGFKFGHWVCESTLRTSAIYTSFGVIQLSILLAFCVLIILISYALVPVLGVIVSKKSKSKHGLGGTTSHIRNQLLRHQLHNMLQLHRIAVEKTYLVEFTGTGDTIPRPVGIHPAPIYGMRRRDTSGTEWEELQGLDQGGNRDDGNGEGDVGLNKNYATMLK